MLKHLKISLFPFEEKRHLTSPTKLSAAYTNATMQPRPAVQSGIKKSGLCREEATVQTNKATFAASEPLLSVWVYSHKGECAPTRVSVVQQGCTKQKLSPRDDQSVCHKIGIILKEYKVWLHWSMVMVMQLVDMIVTRSRVRMRKRTSVFWENWWSSIKSLQQVGGRQTEPGRQNHALVRWKKNTEKFTKISKQNCAIWSDPNISKPKWRMKTPPN